MFKHYIDKYFVNEYGVVKNVKTGKLFTGQPNTQRYLRIDISINGVRHIIYPHRAVAELFIPNPEKKPQVNHIDGNKTNNFKNNLEWVTSKENTQHAVKIRVINSYNRGGKPCVQKDIQGNTIRVFNSMSEASKILNIPQSCINRVCLGQRKSAKGFIFEYLK